MTRAIAILLLLTASFAFSQTSETDKRLAAGLRLYPQADANKDGVLTMQEATAYRKKVMQGKSATAKTTGTAPTSADVSYGPHDRNKLDFWKARSDKPTPVVVFIHGGGFTSGDKSTYRGSPLMEGLLKQGVSCASINYRFRDTAPIQDILHDAARAVQFIRSKASEWNVDKARIAATGGSAGAGTSLWLATRDELADPTHADPVLRESSRVCAAILHGTQATYDLTRWVDVVGAAKPEWMKSPNEDLEFYHFKQREELASDSGKKVLQECDMLGWISQGDAPILCITNTAELDKPITTRGEWLHHPKHAAAIQKNCASFSVPCALQAGSVQTETAFLLEHLGMQTPTPSN